MRINADFNQRAAVHFNQTPWVASPAAGVDRKMLDRIGEEVARATTIVRFAPGSSFAEHTHDGGEEYLVLDGLFEDETGAFPEGTYVRNPPTTHHAPAASNGAIILVKLHQFDLTDRTSISLDTKSMSHGTGDSPGLPTIPLYSDAAEEVRLENWAPFSAVEIEAPQGLEVFVLNGGFTEGGDAFDRWDWLRLPPGGVFQASVGPEGAQVWIKSGHLANMI